MNRSRTQRRTLRAVRPVLQEGFPTAGNWLSRWGVPPVEESVPDTQRKKESFLYECSLVSVGKMST